MHRGGRFNLNESDWQHSALILQFIVVVDLLFFFYLLIDTSEGDVYNLLKFSCSAGDG